MHFRSSILCLILQILSGLGPVQALEVTVSLVTLKDGERVPLSDYHELRRSPYGGWVITLWPF
ncbi:MAG: hypothetical protein QF886_24585, partial [Planctomycetota bacterium]|nr:hypothetical protein [Planctomycetota bacterium]